MPNGPDPRRLATTVDLDDDVFGAPFNGPLVHEVVVAELAARRQGTHATKTRGMVSRRRRQAVAPEGHGPRPRRHDPLADLDRRRHRLRPQPAPLHRQGQPQGPPRRAALRAVGARRARARSTCSTPAAFDAPSTQAGRRPASPTAAAARCWSSSATSELTAAKSFRNLARVNVLHVDDVGVADLVGAATLVVSQAALTPSPAREEARRASDREERRPSMDHSQVIIRPVVSEKSYVLATADKYTFRVHADAHKTQIKQAVEALFDASTSSRSAPRQVPSKPKRRGVHRRPHAGRGRRPSCRCARATPSRSSRASRPTSSMPIRKPKPTSAGRRFITFAGLRGDHEDRAGEDASSRASRSPAGATRYGRKTARHRGGGAKRLYRKIDFKRTQGRRARARSPRSSTTPTGPPTSRCCTTWTAPRPTSSPRTACASA